mmetsp:Transcript_34642/g.56631  ORF Transcript_34642/g.56631 Transcript_34642/m.56631 type:complete len:218 (+) Transcript_34642:533-1186(+)
MAMGNTLILHLTWQAQGMEFHQNQNRRQDIIVLVITLLIQAIIRIRRPITLVILVTLMRRQPTPRSRVIHPILITPLSTATSHLNITLTTPIPPVLCMALNLTTTILRHMTLVLSRAKRCIWFLTPKEQFKKKGILSRIRRKRKKIFLNHCAFLQNQRTLPLNQVRTMCVKRGKKDVAMNCIMLTKVCHSWHIHGKYQSVVAKTKPLERIDFDKNYE